MIETLESIDRQLLLLINGWNSPFFDSVMWFISGKFTWLPLYVVLLWLVIRKTGRNWWIALIGIALTVALADSISVHCFKNVVMRYRPTHNLELEGVLHIVNGYHGGWYGFVSSHAANTFGVATFICLVLKHKAAWIGLMAWAALVCYSRIYIGAHYPADIACGGLLGALCGYAAFRLYQWLCSKISIAKTENQQDGRP
ncbi:MAG: phosphatase PAP2 family protein [Salinivirgaceae bacterium]|nr:phosphatase PAP2 family protein [Salinivirgaceae bacterium]